MKIVHNQSGIAYNLNPDTELEIERTNPFFNEYGEQSLPVELPDTDLNRRLTNYPDDLSVKAKPSKRITATISDGDFVMQCRQAILSAQKKKGISTAFYLNEGAFYDSMPSTKLKTVFGDETVDGISTIEQGIAFCKGLLTTNDDRFSIFPVLIDYDGTSYKWINRIGYLNLTGGLHPDPKPITVENGTYYTWKFYAEFDQSEIVDGNTVSIPAGYYLSPFIKAKYLLFRIFNYFGYTLKENFFSQTSPFTNMVFINNTMDTLAKGVIKYADLVPDCNCEHILNVFRKKFGCEFIPNEVTKEVDIILLKTEISNSPEFDLSNYVTSNPEIQYPESYRQIRLTSEEYTSFSDAESFNSVPDLLASYPMAYFEKSDQCFYRDGFAGGTYTKDLLALPSIPYQAEKTLEVEEIISPDCIPAMIRSDVYTYQAVSRITLELKWDVLRVPYVGASNRLNSTEKYTPSTTEIAASTTSESKNTELKPILSFYYYLSNNYHIGTLSDCDYLGEQLWDYSLVYNGPNGIFERFYRDFDNLLRNSLHDVTLQLNLPNQLKRDIPAYKKVFIDGQHLFINRLKYGVGNKSNPDESEFLSTLLQEPIDEVITEASRFPDLNYRWVIIRTNVAQISESAFNASPYKNKVYTATFPRLATAEDVGSTVLVQQVAKKIGGSYYSMTYHITAQAVDTTPPYAYL